MSIAEVTDHSKRMASITDAAWWDWFGEIRSCNDPWQHWLHHLRFPHEGPLNAWLENDIESAIRTADALRLATTPSTAHFTTIWDAFRHHHEELDQRGKYCRERFMIWRAAALKALCERNAFQDAADAKQARDVLAETMHYFWPTIGADGNFPDGNFWQPKLCDSQRPDPFAEYTAMVLTLLRQALPRSST